MDNSTDSPVFALQRLRSLLRPYRKRVLFSFGLAGAACLLNLAIPLFIQRLVDDVASRREDILLFFAGSLGGIFLLQALLAVAKAHTIGRVGIDVGRDLRHTLYARLQRASVSFFDRTSAGSILSRLMDDVASVQALVSNQCVTILVEMGTALLVATYLAIHHTILFAVAMALMPVYFCSFHWFGSRIRTETEQVRTRLDQIFSHLKSKFDGVLVVKACGREEAEMEDFAAQIEAAHRPRIRVERLGAALASISLAASGIGAALIFAVGALEALHGRMTPGEVITASILSALLFGPVARIGELTHVFQQARASLGRLSEILDLEPDVADPDRGIGMPRAQGQVEFDSIGFSYVPDQPVLGNICFQVEPGMKVALVGPTGCGKTTLSNLLLRFYEPTAGEIRLDGVPLRQLRLEDLRRQVGVVPQEAVLFRDTLANNIRYGTPNATREQVEAAARAALVHSFGVKLPQGYETLIGEGGYKLSEGQRQRVAIARVLCKDPALVILDEATGSLDATSEATIQAALASLLRGRTAFIIAHRLATVIDADRIIVLQQGKVVQAGTHDQLMADAGGLYRHLCLRQFGGIHEDVKDAGGIPAGS